MLKQPNLISLDLHLSIIKGNCQTYDEKVKVNKLDELRKNYLNLGSWCNFYIWRIIIWVRDLLEGPKIMTKKSSLEESNVKLIETLISPSTNPWGILTKHLPFFLFYNIFEHTFCTYLHSSLGLSWNTDIFRPKDLRPGPFSIRLPFSLLQKKKAKNLVIWKKKAILKLNI